MKTRTVALFAIAAIPLMSFDCITESYIISLNLKPFNATYAVNDGARTSYSGIVTVSADSLYDQKYTLTDASIYDVRVSTKGPDLGNGSGMVTVNGVLLLSYNGKWSSFYTTQSLLTNPAIRKNPAGVTEFIDAIKSHRSVVLGVNGTVTTPPALPNADSLTVSAYVQAYGHP